MLSKNTFLGVGVTDGSANHILEYLLQRLKSPGKFYIVTPNPEILVYANRHEKFKSILNSAEISLADGVGLFLASVFMGKPLRQRVPGVDFVEFICKNTVRSPISMGFLGGKRGIAEKTAECLVRKYPHLDVVFVSEEWGESGFVNAGRFAQINKRMAADEGARRKSAINPRKSIDILFVALGAPRQEEWIYQNLDKIPVKAAMGVGGAFDYIAGDVKRAPFLLRAIGFEWLYRLIRQPWRWKRQLALLEFIKLVVGERFGKKLRTPKVA